MTGASDGGRVFCTAPRPKPGGPPRTTADLDDVLYVVDKGAGTVTSVTIPRENPAPYNFRHALYADGALWALAGNLGVIDPTAGTFQVHVPIGGTISTEWDANTSWMYILTTNHVIRFERATGEWSDVVEPIYASSGSAFTQDEEYLYWVQRRVAADDAVLHENGTVLSIAHGDLDDAIVRFRKPTAP